MIVDYIDQHKNEFAVEPICTALTSAEVKIAPNIYYARKKRPPSAPAVRDEQVKTEIARVHAENYARARRPQGPRPARPRRRHRA